MMILINVELTETSRKALVEVRIEDEVHWLVAELPIIDDVKMKLEFDLQGTILFREYEQAEIAFDRYMTAQPTHKETKAEVVTVGEVRADISKAPTSTIYKEKPFIVLSKENVVLWAGELKALNESSILSSGYFDKCILEARTNDLHMNDNTKREGK